MKRKEKFEVLRSPMSKEKQEDWKKVFTGVKDPLDMLADESADMDSRGKRPTYICSMCDDIFDIQGLGHCPRCGHHYPAGDTCRNCHRHVLRKTMKKGPWTVEEYVEILRNKNNG